MIVYKKIKQGLVKYFIVYQNLICVYKNREIGGETDRQTETE